MICKSIKSFHESQFQCLFKAKEEGYCPLHLSYSKRQDYYDPHDDILDDKDMVSGRLVVDTLSTINTLRFSSHTLNPISEPETKTESHPKPKPKPKKKITDVVHKQNADNELDLEVKMLILINEETKEIKTLVGPVFDDVTVSEDDSDPVTMETFWTTEGKKRIPVPNLNVYYLFSYIDKSGKVRCLSIFTVHDMVVNNSFEHPLTREKMKTKDIDRAKRLVEIYDKKLQLFNTEVDTKDMSPEFLVKNRLTKLFKKFEEKTIYFDEKWLLNINDKPTLYKLINETKRLVDNNREIIGNVPADSNLFAKMRMADDTVLSLKDYIVVQWELLDTYTSPPSNQAPIWLIGIGLSHVCKEVTAKYENIHFMIDDNN